MTEPPPIFTLIACPMIGQLGPDSRIIERDPCPTCNQPYPEEVEFLDYELDTWERAELIKAARDNYAITQRLFSVMQQAGLQGLAAQDMQVSRSEVFAANDPENKVVIPEFRRLLLLERADGPSGWWERGPQCPTCQRIVWRATDRVTQALFAKYGNKPGPPRQVSAATWHGWDAFYLSDPGPPVVTERFKRVAEEQKVEGLVLAPAEWVP